MFEPCGSSYRSLSLHQSILRVCVVKIIKTLEQLSPCFVSNLCDDHNHLNVLTHMDKAASSELGLTLKEGRVLRGKIEVVLV